MRGGRERRRVERREEGKRDRGWEALGVAIDGVDLLEGVEGVDLLGEWWWWEWG